MTAFDSYWAALTTSNELPAAVPIANDRLHAGIATATFDVTQNQAVTEGVSSAFWRERAAMAVYACRAAREGIDSEHPEYHSA